jgi:hypothetical protein
VWARAIGTWNTCGRSSGKYADRLADHGDLVLAGDFNHQDREQAARKWSGRQWRFCIGPAQTTYHGHALDEIALSWSPP